MVEKVVPPPDRVLRRGNGGRCDDVRGGWIINVLRAPRDSSLLDDTRPTARSEEIELVQTSEVEELKGGIDGRRFGETKV